MKKMTTLPKKAVVLKEGKLVKKTFATFKELENYFEKWFDIYKRDNIKTKVIGKTIYEFID
ncbi:MAG: hypothetical protein CMB16_00445 [Euryarchaeota archaeon]|nr:hypothetical protein [Euryarchaeota archaeon]|tara:strand:- start:8944 stop:9126 length:183 start_codon:yes stop_codon:yes gene_type:complete